jgi:Leucine-rich repeat (LRR) protein
MLIEELPQNLQILDLSFNKISKLDTYIIPKSLLSFNIICNPILNNDNMKSVILFSSLPKLKRLNGKNSYGGR